MSQKVLVSNNVKLNDMKQIPDIEKRVDKALDSLDGIRRAEPSSYFFTRLKARLAKEEKGWGGIAGLISRPAYALAMVCAVLLVNAWIVIDNKEDPATTGIQSNIEQLSDEYNVAVASFYNYEIP